MVKIRLTRRGAKKSPFYHIIVTDSRAARDSGDPIERVGYFNPFAQKAETPLQINLERVNYWLSTGAKASERVASLIKQFQAQATVAE